MTTEERLEKFERELARMGPTQTVRARHFLLLDENGKTRAGLGESEYRS